MGSRYSFTSSQLQFVTGLLKFERRFSGLLVIAGTNYQLSKADLIRDPWTPPLRGQLVPSHIHVLAHAWVCCCFADFSCSLGACIHSSSLPVITPAPSDWTLPQATALRCFLKDPTAPVLPPSLMLEAIQGVAFDPEAPNDLEICLF